jgi:hypothetical protein
MRRLSSFMLWLAFLGIVAVSAVVLLRACGVAAALFPAGWNFCPSVPASLSAEAERGTQLGKQVAALQRELADKALACASILPPTPPPLELPTERGPLRPQQTAMLKTPPPPPPPPKQEPPKQEAAKPPPKQDPKPLDSERWNNKDLSLLKGCWKLGKETQGDLGTGRRGRSEICQVHTGTICFDDNGSGQRDETATCPSAGGLRCRAPVRAAFGPGTLNTTQPNVVCSNAAVTWVGPQNALTCRRVSDSLALCRDARGYDHEFRR